MAKRILAMLLVVAMVLSVLPVGVLAEGEGQQALTAHDDSKHKCEHCDTTTTWTAWGDDAAEKTKLPTSGHYYLVSDIDLQAQTSVGSGHLVLCLNGHDVVASKNVHMFRIATTGKVTITDCTAKTEEGIYDAGKLTPYSGGGYVAMIVDNTEARFNLYDGIITGAKTNSGSVANMKGNAIFTMYGGEISGNSGSSGIIYMGGASDFVMEGGTIKNNTANNGMIYAYGSGNHVTINGGTICDNTANTSGGVVYARSTSPVTIKNATITGNKANGTTDTSGTTAGNGGGVVYSGGGTVTIENCTITGNTAAMRAGVVYGVNSTVNIKNTEISGNKAAISGAIEMFNGTLTLDDTRVVNNNTTGSYGTIHFWNNGGTASVVLKGKTVITDNIFGDAATSTDQRNLYVRDHWNYINVDALNTDAKVGLFVETNRINATNGKQYLSASVTTESIAACFASDKEGYYPGLSATGRLILTDVPLTPPAPEHPHKLCNDTGCTDHSDLDFKKWTDAATLPTSGNWYLDTDVKLTQQTAVSSGELNLCLNGHTVEAESKLYLFYLTATGKVSITDCTAKTVDGVYTAGKLDGFEGGGVVYAHKDNTEAQFDLYEGIITGCSGASGSVANLQGKGTFNMYGGEISGNSGNSGVIYAQNYALFNMQGGEVKNNTATNGGAFYLYGVSAKLHIENSKVTGNTATTAGGAIYSSGSSVEIINSELSGNKAAQGGAIELNASISNNTATLTLDGANITDNNTTTTYGAIHFWNNGGTASVVLKGETIITDNIFGDAATSTEQRNLYMRDHWNTIKATELSGNAQIGLFVETSRINQTGGKQYLTPVLGGVDVTPFFISDKVDYVPALSDNDRLILVEKLIAPDHPHKLCHDSACTDHADVDFRKWTDATKLPTSGNWYLDTDVKLTQRTEVTSGELNLCLNGHNIEAASNVYLFYMNGTCSVSVTDCAAKTEDGVYTAGKLDAYDGSYAVYTHKNSTDARFNLHEGIITGCNGASGCAANLQGNGTFNMYGGEISGNVGGGSGTIYMANNAVFNALGGTIKNNTAGSGGVFNLASSGAVLTVDGATIMNNEATSYGGAIMAANGAKVNIVSGKITGNKSPAGGAIYMSKKTTLTMTGGEISGNISTGSGAAVYHLESIGLYAGGMISGNEATGSGAAIFNNGANVTLSGATITGNTANNKGGAVYGNKNSKTTVESGEISGNSAQSSGGAIYAGEGAELNLAGGKIAQNKAPSGGGIYATDAGTVVKMSGGQVIGNEVTGSGGGMLIASGTVLNLTGGEISENKAGSGAGLYMSKKSTLNMAGGEITENTASGSGAGVYHLESTGTYTGGMISGHVAGMNAGAMFLNSASVELGSVKITGNQAQGVAAVYPHEATTVTLSGDVQITGNTAGDQASNLYLPGNAVFKLGTLGENAKIGVHASTVFRFISEENDTDYAALFTSDNTSLTVEYKEKKLYLGAGGEHSHCLCDGQLEKDCDHEKHLFAAWNDPTKLPSNGNWYLNTDVTVTASVDVRDVTLNLCLNGHTVTMKTDDKLAVFEVKGGANLNITDCAEQAGTITGATKGVFFGNNNSTAKIGLYNGIITGNSGNNAGAVFLQDKQVFNMYGGKITNNQKESATWGAGAIAAYYGNAQVNIYGGEISGNKSVAVTTKDAEGKETQSGGNAGVIYGEGNSVQINLHGGTICGNAADKVGGVIYVTKGVTVNLKGTKLEGNTAGTKAGAVYATGAAKVNLDGSAMIGNSAPNGGAILIESGAHLEFTSGKVSGNQATEAGGIYVTTRTSFNMTGGEISGNTATGNGGGILLLRCEATISDGLITENSAKYGGGIVVRGCTLNLKGGQITKNTATNNGGGIKTGNQVAGDTTYTAKIVMTDGLISENTAGVGGGVIVEGAGCEMLMQGGEITKNTVKGEGGGLFISTKTVFTMENGKISNNSAKRGGGVQMLNSTGNFKGGEISGNKCESTGGGIYVTESLSVATLSGTTFKNNRGGYGGALCAANRAKVEFKSGTISGNTAVNNGGGMYISTNCILNMYGGTITGNSVEKDTGGGLYGLRSTMNLYGGTISNNVSSVGGGGIMVAAGTANLMGTDILYNTAVSKSGTGGTGGGVRTNCQTVTQNGVKTTYYAKINMTAGTIKGNKCGYGGGGILLNGVGASMTMSGGTICDNVSGSFGGGAYVSNKTVFEMTGGEISRNEAPKEGGGIWLAKDNTYTISNVIFSENYCGKNGGAVYMHNNAKCTYTNVQFDKNVAKNCGGAIFTVQDCNAIMKKCTFTDNQSIDLSGGAVFLRYTGTVEDCVFTGNKSGSNAGALYCGQTSLSVNGFGSTTRRMAGITISGSTFENNEAPALGGAVYIMMSGYTDMDDCTFTGNISGEAGSAIWAEEDLDMANVTATGNKSKNGTGAIYLADAAYDGQSYFKGLFKMSGDMIVTDNEGGDLFLGKDVTVGTTAKGYGQNTKIGVTLDSGLLTQRIFGAYNYEGGNLNYVITYGDRSLTDPEIPEPVVEPTEPDASQTTENQTEATNTQQGEDNTMLYAGIGGIAAVIILAAIVLVIVKKKKAGKAAEEVSKN